MVLKAKHLNSMRVGNGFWWHLLTSCLAMFFMCLATSWLQADLVINEIDSDDTGIDDREFIELFNSGPDTVILDGSFALLGVNGSNESVYFGVDLLGAVDSGGFFVLGSSQILAELPASTVSMMFPEASNSIQNGADAIVLVQGSAADFIDGPAPSGPEVLDVIHYGTNDSPDPELSAIYPDAIYVDEGALGDKDTDSLGRALDGSGLFVPLDQITPGFSNAVNVPEPGGGLLCSLFSLFAFSIRVRNKGYRS